MHAVSPSRSRSLEVQLTGIRSRRRPETFEKTYSDSPGVYPGCMVPNEGLEAGAGGS